MSAVRCVSGLPGVPAYEVTQFRPRAHRYLVAVFVLNEGDRIRAQLQKMTPLAAHADVVVADGGSTDGAVDDAVLAPSGVTARLVKTGAGRLSAQMRMAMHFALAQGYEGLIVMDGNDKDDPSAIPRFAAALDDGVDHVQGSRFAPGGAAVNTPWIRWLAVRLLHAPLISVAARFRYTDTTNGFRAYSRRLLEDPRVAPLREVFVAYEMHYYLAIRAARLGFRVCEVPVTRAYPSAGAVPTKIHGLRGYWQLWRTLLRACVGRFNPPPVEVAAS